MSDSYLLSRMIEIHGGRFTYNKDEKITWSSRISIYCRKHKLTFSSTPSSQLKKRNGVVVAYVGCPICRNEKTRLKKTDFIVRANIIHDNRYDYSKVAFNLAKDKIVVCCINHGDFYQTPNHHIRRRQGCPSCASSQGENSVLTFLIQNKLKFVREYKPSNKHYSYRFDFYIPSLKILIEFDGRQHYLPSSKFGGLNKLVVQQRVDVYKDKLADSMNCYLIRIPYKLYTDIPSILTIEIGKIYKYRINGKFYKTFEEIMKLEELKKIKNITESTINKYLTFNNMIL